MKFTTRLAAGALMVALVAVPATADAKPVSKVRVEVKAGDKSLDRVVSLVGRNRDGAAAKELRKYRRHLRAADRQVRSLRSSVDSAAGAKAYTSSVRMVGLLSNECADALSAIVDDAGGTPQVGIANAINACLLARERLVDALTQVLDVVPEELKPYVTKVIALLSTDGQDEVAGITDALADPALPTDVAGILTHALELATAAIDDAIARLQGLTGTLPAEVQPIVQQALTLVTETLHMVTGMIKDLFTGLFGGTPTGTGTGTGTLGLGGLFGSLPGLNVLQGMFGGGFPATLSPINLPFNISGFGFATR
jgi:hypothetical protein